MVSRVILRWGGLAVVLAITAIFTEAGICAAKEKGGRGFYVDSRSGSDNNTGTKEQPWKSLAAVDNYKFKAGDTVYFAQGSSYEGDLW